MTIYQIVKATEDHARELAEVMRQADIDELWAGYHLRPLEALLLTVSRDTKAGLVDGKVVCMYGIERECMLSDEGVPWMLGANSLRRYAKEFLRGSWEWMQEQKTKWAGMYNFVDARNHMAIRWLRWLGFKIEPSAPFGVDGLLFHRFSWGTA